MADASGKNRAYRWFRYYNSALDNEKVQDLPPHLFRAWVNLLCLASQRNGTIPSAKTIAFRLRISCHDAQSHVEELILAKLIDIMPDGSFQPHDWDEHQYDSDSSAGRMQKHRKNKKKSSGDGDVTADVTSHVTKGDALEQTPEQTSDSDSEDLTSLPEQEAARESGRKIKNIGRSGSGRLEDLEVEAYLIENAVSLGIDTKPILRQVEDPSVERRSGMFITKCARILVAKYPSLSEKEAVNAIRGVRDDFAKANKLLWKDA